MYKFLFGLCLALALTCGNAETVEKDSLPPTITDQIYKKHANAVDLSAEKKNHFSQELLKVNYKEGEDKFVDYFRPDGHFYVSGLLIAADDMMFNESKEKLKTEFNDYRIKQAVLVVNPNGVGEEYDVVLETDGKAWNVVIDKKGNVEKSEIN
jgi:hypothetical protein